MYEHTLHNIDTEVTLFLQNARKGDRLAAAELVPMLYHELRQIARQYMRKERSDHTLQSTALVNEVFLALHNKQAVHWENREHFFRFSSQVMRHLLVDHARQKSAQKRGGDVVHHSLDLTQTDFLAHCHEQLYGAASGDTAWQLELDYLALDDALQVLRSLNERQAQIVDFKFYAGFGIDEIAEVLAISPATVKRDWTAAKLFLRQQMEAKRASCAS